MASSVDAKLLRQTKIPTRIQPKGGHEESERRGDEEVRDASTDGTDIAGLLTWKF